MNHNFTLLACLAVFSLILNPIRAFAADGHADPHWTYEAQERWGELKDQLYRPPFPYADAASAKNNRR
ncbi:hypothetical protein RO575_02775 [Methylomonas sp. MO1]|uniref:hypothetical protein n=1 Tax=Methylomonas sp. MO1 TaxID=3073619 RepID=UPI0028A2F0BA|nr:hypothetical protein [Methylomonas sp. MO1]MDT4288471.1 hypothetical protein [Methylomonas sp. MO1]